VKLRSRFRLRHIPFLLLAALLLMLLLAAPAWAADRPTMTDLSPDYGSVAGRETVTITGTGFTAAGSVNSVTFGDVAASILSVSDTTLVVRTPAHAAGAVDVTVTRQPRPAGDGKSRTLRISFTYLNAPTISTIAPNAVTYPGGKTVSISGSDFLPGMTTVAFNGVPVSGVTVANDTRLNVVVPKMSPGPVVVAVTTPMGTATGSGLLSVTPVNLTITGAVAVNKTYDGTTGAGVDFSHALLVGVIAGDSVTFDSAAYVATFAVKNVDSRQAVTVAGVRLAGPQGGNYTLTQPTGLKAGIAPAGVTATWAVDSKEYDGTIDADVINSELIGVVPADAGQVALAWNRATFDTRFPGTGKTVTLQRPRLTGTAAGNYQLAPVGTTTGSIDRRHLVGTFYFDSKEYDGLLDAVPAGWDLASSSGFAVGVLPADEGRVGLVYDKATFADPYPGTSKPVTVTNPHLSGNAAGYYLLVSIDPATGSIDQRPLTLRVGMDYGSYDGDTAVRDTMTECQLYGLLPEDQDNGKVALDFENPAFTLTLDDPYPGENKHVSVAGASLVGPQADAYYIAAIEPVTCTIEPRDLGVDFTVADKVPDGTTAATITSGPTLFGPGGPGYPGVITGDECSLLYIDATFDTPDPGSNKIVTLNGAQLIGAQAFCYRLTTPCTTTAAITGGEAEGGGSD
jgi:hypothetical protein